MWTHDRKVGIIVLVVAILGVESSIGILPSLVLARNSPKAQIKSGILGKTREEVAAYHIDRMKQLYDVNICYDENDRACRVTVSCKNKPVLTGEQLYEREDYEREDLLLGPDICYEQQNLYKSKPYILRDLGYEMVPAKELNPLFPAILVEQTKQVVPGGVLAEYTPGSGGSSGVLRVAKPQKVSKGYSIGYVHDVYRSRDFEVYASCDIQWGTKRNLGNATYEITIADANIFWTSTIEKFHRLDNLTEAFKEMVQNPAVSEELVQRVATALSKFEDDRFIDMLAQAMRNTDEAVAQRAVTILGKLQDHRAIYPLIGVLRYRTSGPRAAILLKEITGQDFGQDPEQWRKWWFNQNPVRKRN